MRQTIGGTWLLQLMIFFILLFVGFIILTLNYSKTVKMKNEVLTIIEKYEGLNEQSIGLINNFLVTSGYSVTGVCVNEDTAGVYGALALQVGNDISLGLERAQAGEKYYYCVKKYDGANTSNYYQVTLFYRFNLPIIGDTSRFTIKGTTTNFQSSDSINYDYVIGG